MRTPFIVVAAILVVAVVFAGISLAFAGANAWLKTQTTQAAPLGNDCLMFVADVTIPDGSMVPAKSKQTKTWRVQNCGNTTWTNYQLGKLTWQSPGVGVGKDMVLLFTSIPELKPGETGEISVEISVPEEKGDYRIDFALTLPDKKHFFRDVLWVSFRAN